MNISFEYKTLSSLQLVQLLLSGERVFPLSVLGLTVSSVFLIVELSMSWVMTTFIKCSEHIPLWVH